MNNSERILNWLNVRYFDGFCDDCLSDELDITPRQQINQICRDLFRNEKLFRYKGLCNICGKNKLINSVSEENDNLNRQMILESNEEKDAVNSLSMFEFFYSRVSHDTYFYKWAIIALHNALQGFMILALKGTDTLNIYDSKSREKLINHFDNNGDIKWEEIRIENFQSLYKKLKSSEMRLSGISKAFIPTGSEDDSIRKLNEFRNDFIHFGAKAWVIYLDDMPKTFSDCIRIIEFIVNESNNIVWGSEVSKKECKKILARLAETTR